jgi:CubicO group peptidase (beta-lactamase class C family)
MKPPACLILAALIGLSIVTAPCDAGGVTRDAVDTLLRPLADDEWVTGLAVAIVQDGEAQFYGYGTTGGPTPMKPDADSIFEIGSITKVFTSLVLADMVTRGQVALDDRLPALLSDGVALSQQRTRAITLEDLATHRSGLPRLPGDFQPYDPLDPYVNYTERRLLAYLSNCRPGERAEETAYSNLGVGLLGYLLASRAEMPYEQLVIERICRPLGLNDTKIMLDDAAQARLAHGHSANGQPRPPWRWDVLAGCGGLRSTPRDMARFLQAVIDPPPALRKAMELVRQPRARYDRRHAIGLGWLIDDKRSAAWHNGGTGGYNAYIGVIPDQRIGVFVVSNSSSGIVDMLGQRLLDGLLGRPLEPLPLSTEMPIDPATMSDFSGDYVLGLGRFIRIECAGDRLSAQATGEDAVHIYPGGEDRFFYKSFLGDIQFVRNADGKVTSLRLTHGANTLQAPRIR